MTRLFALDERDASTDCWFTPAWIFDGLGMAFDLDVAAPTQGPLHTPCRAWFDESADGLAQPWHGTVWCNPPFSDPAPWCDRYADHPDGIILVRADLSTGGPFRAFSASHAIYVASRRIQFVNATSGASDTSSVNFSSVLLARGAECVEGLQRLARKTSGTTRLLIPTSKEQQ